MIGSSALLNGLGERAGSVPRVAAEEIEKLIIKALQEHLGPEKQTDDRAIINAHVSRVDADHAMRAQCLQHLADGNLSRGAEIR